MLLERWARTRLWSSIADLVPDPGLTPGLIPVRVPVPIPVLTPDPIPDPIPDQGRTPVPAPGSSIIRTTNVSFRGDLAS